MERLKTFVIALCVACFSGPATPACGAEFIPLLSSGNCDASGFAPRANIVSSRIAEVGDLNRYPAGPVMRHWFAFQLPEVTHSVTGAVIAYSYPLLLTNLPNAQPPSPIHWSLSAVNTDWNSITNGGSDRLDLYQDLGDGESYGASILTYPQSLISYQLEEPIRLSPEFIRDVKARPGQIIVLGGRIDGLDNIPGNGEALFDQSQVGIPFHSVFLTLEKSCEPTPSIEQDLQLLSPLQGAYSLELKVCDGAQADYYWFQNGTLVSQQPSYLSITPGDAAAGTYQVIVSNRWGTATSRTVSVPAVGMFWREQPQGLDTLYSEPATLKARLGIWAPCFPPDCSLQGPFFYWWLRDGKRATDILTLSSAESQISWSLGLGSVPGDYRIVVSNHIFGVTTSDVATVRSLQRAPSIAPFDSTHLAHSSSEVLLIDANPRTSAPTTYFWFFEGGWVPDQRSRTLRMSSIMSRSSGEYYLIASNQFGLSTSEVVHVEVRDALPRFSYLSTLGTWLQGHSTSITARVEVPWIPNTKLSLYKGNFPNGSPIGLSLFGTLTLRFDGLASESGDYWWLATHSLGSVTSAVFHVNVVTTPPEFTVHPHSLTVNTDQLFYLQADATGGPPPEIRWFHNDLPLDTVPIGGPFEVEPSAVSGPFPGLTLLSQGLPYPTSSHVLFIPKATASYEGTYYAVAANSAGFATSAVVRVSVNSIAPSFTLQPIGGTYPAGSLLQLQGTALAFPSPEYQWYFNDQPLFGATQSALRLLRPLPTDSGKYQLVAHNSKGTATSDPAFIVLTGAPPGWIQEPNSVRGVPGRTLRLYAHAVGAPAPSIYFETDQAGRTNVEVLPITLDKVHPTDPLLYRAIAFNEIGAITSHWFSVNSVPPDRTNVWKHLAQGVPWDVNNVLVHEGRGYVASERVVFQITSDGKIIPDSHSDLGGYVSRIIRAQGFFVAVTFTGDIWRSRTGESWEKVSTAIAASATGIAFGGDRYVVIDEQGGIRKSSDLKNWTPCALSIPPNPELADSTTATLWTWADILYEGGQFIAVGGYSSFADGLVARSTDGEHWDIRLPRTSKRLRAVHHQAGKYVAVGNDGAIAVSVGGSEWRPRMSGVRKEQENFRGITFCNGLWVAVGYKGVVATSPDAEIWTLRRPFVQPSELRAVATFGDHVVIAGREGHFWASDPVQPQITISAPPLELRLHSGWSTVSSLESSKDLFHWNPLQEFSSESEDLGKIPLNNAALRFYRWHPLEP